MRVSWSALNRIVFAGTFLALALMWVAPSAWVSWLTLSSNAVDSGLKLSEVTANFKESKQATSNANTSKLPKPSEEEVRKASSVALHRMQPPKPAPPPEPTPIVTTPAETVLFAGSLIGIIRDSDPAYCYAVLKWQDNKIQLVAKGGRLNENADSPSVEEVLDGSILLSQGNRKQTLEMRGDR